MMSLIEKIANLRELEQRLEPGTWRLDWNGSVITTNKLVTSDAVGSDLEFIIRCRNLSPAMLGVLECFREGDAEILRNIAERFNQSCPAGDDCVVCKKEGDLARRLHQAAALMEQEMEG